MIDFLSSGSELPPFARPRETGTGTGGQSRLTARPGTRDTCTDGRGSANAWRDVDPPGQAPGKISTESGPGMGLAGREPYGCVRIRQLFYPILFCLFAELNR